ncbi:MAG TPA: FAD:protein FMN transferase [Pseudomonadales bacterium]|nr:FAD:protein FMN transferase [Pseudomonadales bacterium]
MLRRFSILLCVLLVSACDRPKMVALDGQTMGTTYSIKVYAKDVDGAALQKAIDAELLHVNQLMSTYMPDSELSRFNRAPVGQWFKVSTEMTKIIKLSGEIYKLSGGAYDITVGPLVNLWGFGPLPMSGKIPSDAAIAAARARVGFDKLSIRDSSLRRDADIYVDLSSVAKGYGVDQVAELLARRGYKNYLVEIGGELRAHGVNDRGEAWRIAIERPDVTDRAPFTTIGVKDMSIATSGDYRNYFEVDGKRYSHEIDPVTGRPVTHSLASVTVLAPTDARADAFATAIYVMGPQKGMALAEQQNLPVFVILKTSDGFVEKHSSAFKAYLND